MLAQHSTDDVILPKQYRPRLARITTSTTTTIRQQYSSCVLRGDRRRNRSSSPFNSPRLVFRESASAQKQGAEAQPTQQMKVPYLLLCTAVQAPITKKKIELRSTKPVPHTGERYTALTGRGPGRGSASVPRSRCGGGRSQSPATTARASPRTPSPRRHGGGCEGGVYAMP